MRKLAPVFALSLVFAAGTVFAADNASNPDKMGQPTVKSNTQNPQGMSYSDKSTTSPGTNAKMNDKRSVTWNGASTDCSTLMAMDSSKWDASKKKDYMKAKGDCGASATAPTASPGGTNAARDNSTTGTSGK